MFDDLTARGEPLNQVVPDCVPGGSGGVIPVIARLMWPECEEWYPARAVRWTPAAVLVSIQTTVGDPLANKLVWLAPADVKRRHRQPRWQQDQVRRIGQSEDS